MRNPRLSRHEFLRAALGTIAGLGVAGQPPAASGQQAGSGGSRWAGDVENLQYNNPFRQDIGPAWYEGKKLFHFHLNFSNEPPPFKVAQQYIPVYEDELRPTRTVEDFRTQPKVGTVIFDSVPGDPHYSAIWQNNWVVVPRSYQPETLRSVRQMRESGYRVVPTTVFVN